VTEFAPDPFVLRRLHAALAVPGKFLRVSWTAGDGRDVGAPAMRDDEAIVQRFVVEFDAVVMVRGQEPDVAPGMVHYDFEAGDDYGWARMVWLMARDRDVRLSTGVRRRREFGSCGDAAVLWVRTEGKAQAAALKRFRPSPTVVLSEGSTSRKVALWSLDRPWGFEVIERANRRLAYALRTAPKWSVLEFDFAAPGSCLRAGRARPVPVVVEWMDARGVYTARQVVGALKEPPSRDAWRGVAA
jgi:hypothetical protein